MGELLITYVNKDMNNHKKTLLFSIFNIVNTLLLTIPESHLPPMQKPPKIGRKIYERILRIQFWNLLLIIVLFVTINRNIPETTP